MLKTQRIENIVKAIEEQGFRLYHETHNGGPLMIISYIGEDEGIGVEVQLVVQVQPRV